MHSQPLSGQSAAFVQTREQKPRSVPELSVNLTHLPSLHSLLSAQSSPSAFVPPPPELDELLEELEELLLVELVPLDPLDPPPPPPLDPELDEAPDDDPTARQVMFGKSQPEGGLFHAEAGARLRVRYRLARPTRLTLQLMDHSIPDNVHTEVEATRAGLWSELDVAIERLDDNARQGRRVAPGDLIGYVTLRAAADAQGPVDVEVDEVTVYVP